MTAADPMNPLTGEALDRARAAIEYRTIDKSGWITGPWTSEPDKRQWRDPDTGLPCLIVRGPVGALCGYVGVHPDHPFHGLGYYHSDWDEDAPPLTPAQVAINDLDVHGGLTFAKGCGHSEDPSRGICHIPAPGEPDNVWWFGFDCSHCDDLAPGMNDYGFGRRGVYRDIAYVTEQVTSLAGQIALRRGQAIAGGK